MSEREFNPEIKVGEPHFSLTTIEMTARDKFGSRMSQDAWAVREFMREGRPVLVVAVGDGHGYAGAEIAKLATQRVVRDVELASKLDRAWLDQEFISLHTDVVREAVRMKEAQEGQEPGIIDENKAGGTTLTVVEVSQARILTAHVGDSQARLSLTSGQLKTLTLPHRYRENKAEQARLERAGAVIDPVHRRHILSLDQRTGLMVSRSIGDKDFGPEILRTPGILEKSLPSDVHFLVVASDGFWDKVQRGHERHQVEVIMREASDVASAKQRLVELFSRKQIDDEITVIIVDLKK